MLAHARLALLSNEQHGTAALNHERKSDPMEQIVLRSSDHGGTTRFQVLYPFLALGILM